MSETPDFILDRNPGDTAIPRFYMKPVQNTFRTKEKGSPQFDDVEHVEILIPGDRRSTWDGMVNDGHRQRWPRQYAAFKESRETPMDGTPLSEWAGISRSQAEELAFMKVRTVEALASLSDQQLNNCIAMGGFDLREKAKRFLEQAAGGAPAEKLAAENEALRAKNAELEGHMKDVLARLSVLETNGQQEPQAAQKG